MSETEHNDHPKPMSIDATVAEDRARLTEERLLAAYREFEPTVRVLYVQAG